MLPSHLAALPGGSWAVWRALVLRGAGFPAHRVLGLADPALGTLADNLLTLETEAESLRRQAIAFVDRRLDELRAAGEWHDRSRKAPLLEERQALARDRWPISPEPDVTAEPLAAFRAGRSALQEALAGFGQAYEAACSRTSEEISRIAASGRFREAVVWQNLEAAVTGLDEIVRNRGSKRNSRRRQHEELAASYLQRYCVKNDTIGFFGPVAWSAIADEGAPVSFRTKPQLLDHRQVYFESWCIDALAARLAEDLALRPWLAPRLRGGFHLSGQTIQCPGGRTIQLSAAQAKVLQACDGTKTAEEIAEELGDREQVFEILPDLCDLGLCIWTLDVPLELHPERTLRRLLSRVKAEAPRARALAALDELEEARRRVEQSAGDAVSLETSLRALEDTFVRLTDMRPRRHLGQFYAARGLVYEDCRRAVEVSFGPEVLRRLGPPLTLLLRGARWLVGEMTRRVNEKLLSLHARLREQSGSPAVDSSTFFSEALAALFLDGRNDPCFGELREDFQARWQRVLSVPLQPGERHVHRTTEEAGGRFEEAFAEAGPAWSLVRYFSPDIMIAAGSEERFRAGEFQLVLGEIHPTHTLSWSCFASQHPRSEELLENLAHDMASHLVVMPQLPKKTWAQRMNISLVLPHFFRYEVAEQTPGHPPCRSLPAAGVLIERDGDRLVARTRDGQVRFDAVELFGIHLTEQCTRILGSMFPFGQHAPRVTLDDLVIARERWRFALSGLDFPAIRDPAERFLAVRRWARLHGLPRFCFYRAPGEVKPVYLDLDSPIYVDIFARLVRSRGDGPDGPGDLLMSEMLPRIDQTWLCDHEGHRFTCELRLAALEADGFIESAPRPRR